VLGEASVPLLALLDQRAHTATLPLQAKGTEHLGGKRRGAFSRWVRVRHPSARAGRLGKKVGVAGLDPLKNISERGGGKKARSELTLLSLAQSSHSSFPHHHASSSTGLPLDCGLRVRVRFTYSRAEALRARMDHLLAIVQSRGIDLVALAAGMEEEQHQQQQQQQGQEPDPEEGGAWRKRRAGPGGRRIVPAGAGKADGGEALIAGG
jgi:hypothetical protein